MSATSETLTPGVVITLVHGTFARGAPWTQPDSALRRFWPSTPACPVRFSVFEWSGENSHLARTTASQELAEDLRRHTTACPDARHLVIAHSHGGNVALGALADPALKRKITALVCLNTPFLHCAARRLEPFALALLLINPLCLLMLASSPVLERYMFPRYPGEFWRPVLILSGYLFAAMIPVGVAAFWFWGITSRLLGRVERYQERRRAELHSDVDTSAYVLAATVKGDEAYRYLWLLDRLTAISTAGAWVSLFLCLVGVGLFLLAGSGGFLTDFNWFPALTRAALVSARYAALAVGAGIVLFLFSAVLTATACAILRRHKFSYGEFIADGLFLRISTRPYPAERLNAEVRYFEVTSGGLKHSALYGSPDVVRSLAGWFYQL